jgi:hypothetical protein
MAGEICTHCGAAVDETDRFCPSCGAAIEDVAAGPAPVVASEAPAPLPAAAAAFGGARGLTRFGQIAKTVALLAFLLPWVTVSCAGQQIASVTGLRLATGVVTVRNPVNGTFETHSGSVNWAVLLAAVAIVLALLISFVRAGRTGALGGLICSAAAAALCIYAVLIEIPQQLAAGVRQQQGGGSGGTDLGSSLAASVEHMIRVDAAIGFWITLVALVAACIFDWMVQRRRPDRMPPGEPS